MCQLTQSSIVVWCHTCITKRSSVKSLFLHLELFFAKWEIFTSNPPIIGLFQIKMIILGKKFQITNFENFFLWRNIFVGTCPGVTSKFWLSLEFFRSIDVFRWKIVWLDPVGQDRSGSLKGALARIIRRFQRQRANRWPSWASGHHSVLVRSGRP